MTELRLHRKVYAAAAIDEAAKVYAPYAGIEQSDDGEHRLLKVTVTKGSEAREKRVVRELANYALGLSIAAHRR